MTDREYLELAAKAAGIYCKGWAMPGGRSDGWHGMYTGSDDDGAYVRWNPLVDDGDALRLAVKIGTRDYFGIEVQKTCAQATCFEPWEHCEFEYHKDHQDPLAATRRAIVRAAAEIGRSMA